MKSRKLISLFDDCSDKPLFIVSDAPPSSCNFRCPYCFYHKSIGFEAYSEQFENWKSAMSTALEKIKRPLYLCIGPRGDPMEVVEWWPEYRKIAMHPNVKRAAFVSNLSKPIAPLIDGIDPNRIGVTGTIHPTQWKDKDHGFAQFVDNVMHLKNIGAAIVLNYVLAPYQISEYMRYKNFFEEREVPVTCNLFRGTYKGKVYPESYTQEEWSLAKENMSDIPYYYEFQSRLADPFGRLCTAGRHAINMEADGSVYPCYFVRTKFGSIFDDQLFLLDEDIECSSHICECKWSIPLQRELVSGYRHVGNIHQIVKRPDGETGDNPFS